MKISTFVLLALASVTSHAQTTLFEQNFDTPANGTISDFNSGGPNKFTSIFSGTTSTSTIQSGALVLNKQPGEQVRFAKTDDLFSTPPPILYVQFTISVDISSGAAANQYNYVYLGSNLSDNGSFPANANVYARLGFNFSSTGTSFSIHDQENGLNKGPFSGTQLITWILNTSAAPITYNDNQGHSGTVAVNRTDVWVGGGLEFDDVQNLGNSSIPQDIKFLFNNGNGLVQFDNFKIQGSLDPLPVELTYFRAQPTESGQVRVQWGTASEKNSKYFAIERSADALEFTGVARRDAAGNANESLRYEVTDDFPLTGTSYYRLRQVDLDGSQHLYRPVSVSVGGVNAQLRVFPNPSDGQHLVLRLPDAQDAIVSLRTISGAALLFFQTQAGTDEVALTPSQPLTSGVYLLSVKTSRQTLSQKVVVR